MFTEKSKREIVRAKKLVLFRKRTVRVVCRKGLVPRDCSFAKETGKCWDGAVIIRLNYVRCH